MVVGPVVCSLVHYLLLVVFVFHYYLLCLSFRMSRMTSEVWNILRDGYSFPSRSGSLIFVSRDFENIFHVVRGVLRCCTEGVRSRCPGTYDGFNHNGHARIATSYLIDQELNIAFRSILAAPPPGVQTTRQKLKRFVEYGCVVARSVVPLSHQIHPMWTDSGFRRFQIARAKSVAQFEMAHPGRVAGAYLPLPLWDFQTGGDYVELYGTSHRIWALTLLSQASDGSQTAGVPALEGEEPDGFTGTGYPAEDGVQFREVDENIVQRNWLLDPPLEDGTEQPDGEVPDGYKFMFPLFGPVVAAVPLVSFDGSSSSTTGRIFYDFMYIYHLFFCCHSFHFVVVYNFICLGEESGEGSGGEGSVDGGEPTGEVAEGIFVCFVVNFLVIVFV